MAAIYFDTQVATFGAKVTGCSAQKAISLEAEMNVKVGLRNRPSGTPRRLLYEMSKNSKGSWRINNITYLDEPGFQLRPYLKELLNPAS